MAMPKWTKGPVSRQDILDLPENVTGEIINGELVVSPRPAVPATFSASGLGMMLGSRFQFGDGGPGSWWILYEPELELERDRNHIVPDLTGWRKSRVPRLPDGPNIAVLPDWLCEVLSPSSRV